MRSPMIPHARSSGSEGASVEALAAVPVGCDGGNRRQERVNELLGGEGLRDREHRPTRRTVDVDPATRPQADSRDVPIEMLRACFRFRYVNLELEAGPRDIRPHERCLGPLDACQPQTVGSEQAADAPPRPPPQN